MIFAHRYDDFRRTQMDVFERIVAEEGQRILAGGKSPLTGAASNSARSSMPRFIQVFIARGHTTRCGADFERKLYTIRKRAERAIIPLCADKGGTFYVASLSSKTIVYKGMLTAKQLREFYLDLSDLDFDSALAMVHSRFSTNTFPAGRVFNRYVVHNGRSYHQKATSTG